MATTQKVSPETILESLAAHPRLTAAKLAEVLGIGQSTAAKHLATLEVAGTARREPGGRDGGRRAGGPMERHGARGRRCGTRRCRPRRTRRSRPLDRPSRPWRAEHARAGVLGRPAGRGPRTHPDRQGTRPFPGSGVQRPRPTGGRWRCAARERLASSLPDRRVPVAPVAGPYPRLTRGPRTPLGTPLPHLWGSGLEANPAPVARARREISFGGLVGSPRGVPRVGVVEYPAALTCTNASGRSVVAATTPDVGVVAEHGWVGSIRGKSGVVPMA